MGAHSLGGALTIFSGYNGEFTPGEVNKFDNKFYQILNNPSLKFVNKVCLRIII